MIEYLCERSLPVNSNKKDKRAVLASLCLANCIANEVPMNQELLEKAIVLVMKSRRAIDDIMSQYDMLRNINVYDTILKGKYGKSYCEIAEEKLFLELEEDYLFEFCDAWIDKCYSEHQNDYGMEDILKDLSSADYKKQITGTLIMMMNAFHGHAGGRGKDEDRIFEKIYINILRLLQEESSLSIFTAAWCIAWSGYDRKNLIPQEIAAKMCIRLADLWVNRDMSYEIQRTVSWAIVNVCMPSFQRDMLQGITGLEEKIERCFSDPSIANTNYLAY